MISIALAIGGAICIGVVVFLPMLFIVRKRGIELRQIKGFMHERSTLGMSQAVELTKVRDERDSVLQAFEKFEEEIREKDIDYQALADEQEKLRASLISQTSANKVLSARIRVLETDLYASKKNAGTYANGNELLAKEVAALQAQLAAAQARPPSKARDEAKALRAEVSKLRKRIKSLTSSKGQARINTESANYRAMKALSEPAIWNHVADEVDDNRKRGTYAEWTHKPGKIPRL